MNMEFEYGSVWDELMGFELDKITWIWMIFRGLKSDFLTISFIYYEPILSLSGLGIL